MSSKDWSDISWNAGILVIFCIMLAIIITPFIYDEDGIFATRRLFTTGWLFPADWVIGVFILSVGISWSATPPKSETI